MLNNKLRNDFNRMLDVLNKNIKNNPISKGLYRL